MQNVRDYGDGRYETLTLLGEGGTAEVWRVLDTRLQVERAIKVMLAPPNDEARVRQRREAQVMASLEHPNVVVVHDTFEEDGRQLLVMEMCEESAAQRVARLGVIEPAEVTQIALAILSALSRAHEDGVVHRDIKPHNILFSKNGVPKLADFGLAWARDMPGAITRTGAVMGSIAYMAPEQRRGDIATAATDLYGLAATLFFLLTGDLPADLYVTNNWDKVAGVIPDHLLRVLVRAGRLDPNERFDSAKNMAQAISGRNTDESDFKLESEFVLIPRVSRARYLYMVGFSVVLVAVLFIQVSQSIGGPLGDTIEPEVSAAHYLLSLKECDDFGLAFSQSRYPDRSSHAPGLREASVATFYDIDRDGHMDYAIAHILDEKIRIFWGDSTGDINEDFTDIVTMRVHGMAFGDINSDGLTDLVTTDPTKGELGLTFGTGPRLFGEFEISDEDMGAHQVAIGDWNRDGNQQVILNTIRRNQEVLSRSFDEEMGLGPFNSILRGLHSMDMGDIDGDGEVELVGLNSENQLLILTRENGEIIERVVPRPHAVTGGEVTRTTLVNVVTGVGVFIDSTLTLAGFGELYKLHNGAVDVCRVLLPLNARTRVVGDVTGDGILDVGQAASSGYSTSQYKLYIGQ